MGEPRTVTPQVDEHIENARKWAASAPSYRLEDYTPADCYARANYHILLALTEILRGHHA